MKKTLLAITLCCSPTLVLAAQTPVTQIDKFNSAATKIDDVRVATNVRLAAAQSNFTELYTLLGGNPWLAQTTAPNIYNVFWIDTAGSPPTIKYWDGDSWEVAASGGDGAYTLPTATVGQILQADADGVYRSVSEIAGLINDAGTATDDLWSAAKNIAMLAGKQATLVSGTNIKTINSQAITGAGNVTISGTFGFDTYPTYEDSPHDSGIAVNGTTLAVYSATASKWLTVGLTDTLGPTPSDPILSSITVGTLGLSADMLFDSVVSFGVGGNTGLTMTCSVSGAVGLTYSSGAETATLSYALDPTPTIGEVCTVDYVQPVDGIQRDSDGVDVASFSSVLVDNQSTVASGGISDLFTASNDTALASYNSDWVSANGSFLVSNFEIISNAVTTTTAFGSGGAYNSSSTSDTSQVTLKGLTDTSQAVNKYLGVRMDGTSLGYNTYLGSLSGGNWNVINIRKNATLLGTSCTGLSISAGTDHEVRIVADGTSTVTVTVFVDDVQSCQKVDSVSTIPSGHPGFFVTGNGTIGNNAFDTWSDYE